MYLVMTLESAFREWGKGAGLSQTEVFSMIQVRFLFSNLFEIFIKIRISYKHM